MTNILHKRSSTPGSIPGSGDLTTGEIALNTADGTWFIKKTDDSVIDLRKPDILDGGEIDMDAVAYINAVEVADTTILEQGVRAAIYNLIVGLKYDQLWDSIGAMCLLAGPRTVDGCMIPLRGPAPTNFGFAAANYNRETGIQGNSVSTYINTNYANNANPQNDQHVATWATALGIATRLHIGANPGSFSSAGSAIYRSVALLTQSRGVTIASFPAVTLGFEGVSRTDSSGYIARNASTNVEIQQNSSTPGSANFLVFSDGAYFASSRLAFYSIGAGLDLAKLEARISTYLTTIAAVL
jgi:hypothetical protein